MKKSMALLLFAAILAAAGLEGAGRLWIAAKEKDLLASPHLNWTIWHEYDPDLMWRMKAGLKDVQQGYPFGGESVDWILNTNELGLRQPPIAPKGARFRILIIGDSRTYGLGVNDAETWPAQLQAALVKVSPGAYDVINAGVTGYTAYQGLRYLERDGLKLEPDVVLVCFGYNAAAPIPAPGIGDRDWENPAESCGFVALLKDAVRGAGLERPPLVRDQRTRLTPGEVVDTLIAIRDTCAGGNIAVAYLAWPHFCELIGEACGPAAYTPLVREAGKLARAPVIELADTLRGAPDAIYLDDIHLNAAGYGLVARHVAEELPHLIQTGFRADASEAGDLDAAIEACRAFIVINPAHYAPYARLDALFGRRNDIDEAVRQWRAIADKHALIARPHLYLGRALAAAGYYDGAAKAYARCAELDTKDPAPLSGLGEALAAKGDAAGAASAFSKALELDPRNERVRERLAEMRGNADAGLEEKLEGAQ